MSLRYRILAILVFVVVVHGLLYTGVQYWVILPSFAKLEQEEAKEDLARVTNALQRELNYLDTFCHDWSGWDDMYAYVTNGNRGFEDANLVVSSFVENRLALIYIIDAGGRVVWGRIYDLETGEPFEMEEIPPKAWAVTHPLLQHPDERSSISGVWMTGRGPILLASRPIVNSSMQGPIRGTVIMGRFLDDAVIQSIRDQTRVKVALWPARPDSIPEGDRAALGALTPERPWYRALNAERLYIYTTFPGLTADGTLLIRAEIVRDITLQGKTIAAVALMSTLVVGLAVLLVVLISLRAGVIAPLASLTAHVTHVSKEDDLTLFSSSARNDEIGTLAREFNHMVRRIQSDRAERRRAEDALRESETRIRTILENAPDGVITVSETGVVESFNPAAQRLFGYTGPDIVGQPLRDLIPDLYPKGPQGASQDGPVPPSGVEGVGRRKDGTYVDMEAGLLGRIPALPTRNFQGETVGTLNSTLRVRHGLVGTSGNSEIGQPNVTGNTYKETMDGTFVSDGWTGTSVASDGGRGDPTHVYSDNGWDKTYDLGNRVPMPMLTSDWHDPVTGARHWDTARASNYTHEHYFDEVLVGDPVNKTDGIYTGNITIRANQNFYYNASRPSDTDITHRTSTDDYIYYNGTTKVMEINGQITINGNLSITRGNGNDRTINYTGRAAILVHGDVTLDTDLLTVNANGTTANSFPVNNFFGIMASGNMYIGSISQLTYMGAFYAQGLIRSAKQSIVLGSFVSNYFDMGTNVPKIFQVPSLADNLPLGMIGNYPIFAFSPVSWRELSG